MTSRAARRDQTLELIDVSRPDPVLGTGGAIESTDGSLPMAIIESFDSFYRREFPRLVTLARALAGSEYASDVAQDAMLVAYRRWDEVRAYQSPTGWVRGVCAHRAASLVRRKATERRALARLHLRRADHSGEVTVHDMFWHEVRQLPRRQAQVTALFYALDLTLADIAITLDCAEGTVKAHLFRARATLAQRLGVDEEGEA